MNDNDPLTIPDDWSDQQALAIFDFLDKLRETVWREYREGIIHQLRTEVGETELKTEYSELVEFDDDIDF
jgi:hypothetical protein